MSEFDQLVGIPFADHGRTKEGADCWGLIRMGLALFGVEVPSYGEMYSSTAERIANAELIRRESGAWHEIDAGHEQRLDLILMRDGRYPSHVGLVIKPGRMLHTYSGGAACVDRYRSGLFRERIVGFYRHQSLA